MKFLNMIGKGTLTSLILFLSLSTHAAIITSSVGNTTSGYADGDIVDVWDLAGIQGGQIAPFDQSYGLDIDLFGPGADPGLLSWDFTSLLLITDPIISATLSIGLIDIDSIATGSQLDQFLIDGIDKTTELNDQFELKASVSDEFNIFTIDLGPSFFASLADGSFSAGIDIGGKGSVFNLFPFPGGDEDTDFNGINLVFSTLTIETGITPPPPNPKPVPEPSTLVFFAFALLASLKLKLGR